MHSFVFLYTNLCRTFLPLAIRGISILTLGCHRVFVQHQECLPLLRDLLAPFKLDPGVLLVQYIDDILLAAPMAATCLANTE